jgi:broad specificity phosphatase PhoE
MKLVLIRRPDTNKEVGLSGEPDAPSPAGQEQLAQAAQTCRAQGVQAVVHSVTPRAALAAVSLAQSLDVPHIAQDGLQERNFGDWNEWEWPQIAAELSKLTVEARYTFVPPHGESWQQMEVRLREALDHVAGLGYDCVAIMTHAGPIRALLPVLKDEPKESTLQLDVGPADIFVGELR